MSLINEALKEAQREAHERTGRQSRIEVADTFFPYPEKPTRARISRLSLRAGGAVVAVVLLLASAGVFLARGTFRQPSAPVVAPLHQVVSVRPVALATPVQPVAPAPSHAISIAPPAAKAALPGAKAAAVAIAARPLAKRAAAAEPDSVSSTSAAAAVAPVARVLGGSSKNTQLAARPADSGVVIETSAVRPTDSLFKQGYAEQARGNDDRAKELYERAIAQPEASADAFNNLGVLLAKSGNQVGAAELFKQALARDDKSVNAWINLGDSYNAVGHHAEAMSAFARAEQLDGSAVAVKVRLAVEYDAIGDTASARRQYEQALQVAPSDPSVHYSFGKFLQAQHDARGAIREYQRFVDLAPGKYSAENIEMIRKHIAALDRLLR